MAGTPTEALKAFQQAAKVQTLEDVWKHTAQFEGRLKRLEKWFDERNEALRQRR
jgi:hypothetical protein